MQEEEGKSKIPKDDVVKFIIKQSIKKSKVRSQKAFSDIINSKLKTGDEAYTISAKRARLIAMHTPNVKIHIHTKRGGVPAKCPSCEHRLKKVYSKNLSGKKILVKLKCTKCSYTGSNDRWIPTRYEFEFL